MLAARRQTFALNNRLGFQVFPLLARQYGTSGSLAIGYDITADGQPTAVRTIWAMPPFLFDANTETAIKRFRFSPVFRPGATAGCVGSSITVNFRTATER